MIGNAPKHWTKANGKSFWRGHIYLCLQGTTTNDFSRWHQNTVRDNQEPKTSWRKNKYNIWEEQINTDFRYYNSQTGFKNFCTQDLKLDNSYRKHKINFLKTRKFGKEPNKTSINITCYSHEESATDLWHMAQQQETMFGWLTIWSSKFFVSALFCYALSHRD